MVLGVHMVLLQSWSQNWENRPNLGFFECVWIYMTKSFSIKSVMEVYINCSMLGKILEKFGFWDMCQNILGQSTISLEQNGEKVLLSACRYKFIEIKSWLKNVEMGLVINRCVSGCRNLNCLYLTKKLME